MIRGNVYLIASAMAVLISLEKVQAQSPTMKPEMSLVISPCMLKLNVHKLWSDHAQWTRNVILCAVDELPGSDQAYLRLLENQDDLGNAIKPYLGDDVGERLSLLLKQHVSITHEVVQAIKSEATYPLEHASAKWYGASEEIAILLSENIREVSREVLSEMLLEYSHLAKEVMMQRQKKEYGAEIVAYDKMIHQALQISTILSEGIIKQFPEKLKSISANR